MKNNNEQLIAGLREFADFLEATPEFERVNFSTQFLYLSNAEQVANASRMMAKGSAKPIRKVFTEQWVNVERHFGPVTLQATVKREQVCTRQVRTETVVKKVAKCVTAAVYEFEDKEVTEEVVSWDCPESLLGFEKDAVAK